MWNRRERALNILLVTFLSNLALFNKSKTVFVYFSFSPYFSSLALKNFALFGISDVENWHENGISFGNSISD